MTVKELIAELQKLPKSYEDAPIGFYPFNGIEPPKFREYKTLEVVNIKDGQVRIGLYI